jgi:phosphatidylinositol-3-phosphatase
MWRVGACVGAMSLGACAPTGSSGSRSDIGGEQYRSLETATVTSPTQSLQERAPHSIKTVFLVMMENHNWSQIKGNPSAPYINGTLLQIGAHAEQYVGGAIHPSEPNYILLESGSDLGISNDAPPAYNDRTTRAHLTTFLEEANVSWKSYQEGIAGDSCPLTAVGFYDPKHDPMVYFDDALATCVQHVRPYAELESDLAAGTVPDYNFITPNLCHDMHGASGCPNGDEVASGDAWLATEVPKILASSAYRNGGALFIVWDEGGGSDGPIGLIAVSPFARAGYASDVAYSHSSTLRTVQEIFAVQPYLRAAATATSLSDLFIAYP